MASEAQVTANRRNAAKSTGPRTKQGKAVVADNAIKHGLLARQDVVLGEDLQEFELRRRQWLAELQPVGYAEITLAERIAGLAWRLKRAERLQNEAFDSLLARELAESMADFDDELSPEDERELMSDPSADPRLAVGRMVAGDFHCHRALERLMMFERRIENSLYRTMKELRQVQRERKADGEHSPVLGPPVSRVAPPNSLASSHFLEMGPMQATQNSGTWDEPNSFDGAHSNGSDHPQDHGQTGLPVPPGAGNSVKQSQSGASQADHCFAETQDVASLQPDDAAGSTASDCAKQSQILPEAPCETKPMESEVSSLKCEVSSDGPALQTSHGTHDTTRQVPDDAAGSAASDCAKQSQILPEVPCETKPMDSGVSSMKFEVSSGGPALQTSHCTLDTTRETPCGVTTNEDGDAKQSQRRKRVAGAGAMPRPRPRVAYHCHDIARSY